MAQSPAPPEKHGLTRIARLPLPDSARITNSAHSTVVRAVRTGPEGDAL